MRIFSRKVDRAEPISEGVRPIVTGKTIRALVLTTNYRNADNWLELFQKINNNGGDCQLVSLRWTGDPSYQKFANLGLKSHFDFEISSLGADGISPARLEEVVREMVQWEPDVIFITDVQSYPSSAIYNIVRKYTTKVICIGLQHGYFQSWYLYNKNFCADYMFLFGDRHVREIRERNRARCFAVGLPKLDRLKEMPTTSHGYLLYISQRFPNRTQVTELLKQISEQSGIPVLANNHPQFGGMPDAPTSGNSFISLVSAAEWVMSSYSTGAIEAIYLGKEVVLLPSHGTTAWYGYPAIARELTVSETLAAKRLIKDYPDDVAEFLHDAIGGIRFDHTDRAWATLSRLISEAF